ncbi:MAG: hypothetical protein ACYSX0_08925 [Planctomycetota bacterium]
MKIPKPKEPRRPMGREHSEMDRPAETNTGIRQTGPNTNVRPEEMHPKRKLPSLLAMLLALALIPACPDSDSATVFLPPDAAQDFALMDVNPNSATFGTAISPRDHVGHLSVWYFGSAT